MSESSIAWKPFYICPKCGYPQYCGCASCKDRIPEGIKPQKRTSHGTQCGNCGFAPDIGWWMDYEWDLAVEGGRIDIKYSTYVFQDWDGGEIQYI